MFGAETQALGGHYLEAARIAYKCAQHDQFVTTQHSQEELERLEASKYRMIGQLMQRLDVKINMNNAAGNNIGHSDV